MKDLKRSTARRTPRTKYISKRRWYDQYRDCDEVFALAVADVDRQHNIVSWVGVHKLEVDNSEASREPRARRLWSKSKDAELFRRRIDLKKAEEYGYVVQMVVLNPPRLNESYHPIESVRCIYNPAGSPGWCLRRKADGFDKAGHYFGLTKRGTYRVWRSEQEAKNFLGELIKVGYPSHAYKVVPSPFNFTEEIPCLAETPTDKS